FFANRRRQQAGYLEQIRAEFGKYGVVEVPMLDTDIEGIAELEKVAPMLAVLDKEN
ncbi:MAG: arsenic-transporting ATPase, partial [Pyramidobacter sp.]|nr:arsenic-transporting ATPase [Pyramidobacter sp.]